MNPRWIFPSFHRLAPENGEGRSAVGLRSVGRPAGRRTSAMKGRKVPEKYRGPEGETWAGRGAQPRWLVAALKEGKKLDDFLIEKSGRRTARKTRGKRQ